MATEKKLTVRELLEQAKAKGSISGKELVAYIDENELELDTIEKRRAASRLRTTMRTSI